MGFKLGPDARKYFKGIDKESGTSPTGNLEVLWDPYYICLMVGIIHRRATPDEPTGQDFLDTFPSQYHAQHHEILAALVSAELDRIPIPRTEEPQVRALMLKLFGPDHPTALTNLGMSRMNSYAQAGYEILSDKIGAPTDLSDFLAEVHELVLRQDINMVPASTGVVKGRRST